MARKLILGLAIASAGLCWSVPAQAETISGSGFDPRGDARADRPDLERLTVGYDDSVGLIQATYRMYEGAFNDYEHLLSLRFGLSKPGQGGCSTPATEPDLDFRATLVFADEPTPHRHAATFNLRTGYSGTVPATFTFAPLEYHFTLRDPRLIRMGLRCVTRVFANIGGTTSVGDGDQIARFCLGASDCVAAPPPPPPPPPPSSTGSGFESPPQSVVVVQVPGQTPIVQAPASEASQRVVYGAQAAFQTRRALRLLIGKAFKSGARYRSACDRDTGTKWTCSVSWRYKGQRYGGNVIVRLRGDVYRTTVNVQRRV